MNFANHKAGVLVAVVGVVVGVWPLLQATNKALFAQGIDQALRTLAKYWEKA